ncbi:MAG: hypothetical protein ACTS5I_00370, partial [Rhodanobacter sp.]
AYMYRLTGREAYGKLAVEMVERQVSDAEAAIAAGNAPDIADDSYLYVGPMLRDLSLTYDWCGARLTVAQKARWSAYANRTISNVWHPLLARWGLRPRPWTGWATDDPGNNYFFSFVEATMYWALASDNADLKGMIRDRQLPMLEKYFAALPGGGSREGTSYGASLRTLFGLYRLWHDATGSDLANANSHLTETISYWVHATVPTFDQFAPIGDQSRVSMPVLYDYERWLMLEARKSTNDRSAAALATWWLKRISIQRMSSGFNSRHDLLPVGDTERAPDRWVYHAIGAGQLFARSSWNKDAMWLDFSVGTFDQSHGHEDQGSFTLFAGDWLAVTANIWTHGGVQRGTNVANIVRFEQGGAVLPQRAPSTSRMNVRIGANGRDVHASADLTPAYGGSRAVRSWHRVIDFAQRSLTVHDTFALGSNTQAIFQVNVPTQPKIEGRTASAGHLHMTVVTPLDARISVVPWKTVDADFNSGWRIEVRGSGDQFVVKFDTDLSAQD